MLTESEKRRHCGSHSRAVVMDSEWTRCNNANATHAIRGTCKVHTWFQDFEEPLSLSNRPFLALLHRALFDHLEFAVVTLGHNIDIW